MRDVERSLRFYRDLLGVPLGDPETHEGDGVRHVHAAWGSWDREGAFLLFSLYPARPGEETRTNVGFVVDDLDVLHDRLARASVEVVRAPSSRPWGRSASYRDPDGNPVSLIERPR